MKKENKTFDDIIDERKNEIGKRIKNLRIELNYSQEQLADKTKLGKTTIGNYETGKRVPQGEELLRLATAFNVPCSYILCDTDAKQKDNIQIKDEIGLSEDAIDNLRKMKNSKFKTRENYSYFAIEKMLEDVDNVDDYGIDRLLPEIGLFLLQPSIENKYLSDEARRYLKTYKDDFKQQEKIRFLSIYELLERIHKKTSQSERASEYFMDINEDKIKYDDFD